MLRVFTKDVGSKFRQGDVRDYLPNIWKQIARSADAPLESFTINPEDAAKRAIAEAGRERPRRGRPRSRG